MISSRWLGPRRDRRQWPRRRRPSRKPPKKRAGKNTPKKNTKAPVKPIEFVEFMAGAEANHAQAASRPCRRAVEPRDGYLSSCARDLRFSADRSSADFPKEGFVGWLRGFARPLVFRRRDRSRGCRFEDSAFVAIAPIPAWPKAQVFCTCPIGWISIAGLAPRTPSARLRRPLRRPPSIISYPRFSMGI